MSWQSGRPIYHRLPVTSEHWQGNQIVDWLVSFWDDLLTQTKGTIDSPEDWLGPDPNEYFLDWVGMVLCGLGEVWQKDYPIQTKQSLIKNWLVIREYWGSERSLTQILNAIDPGTLVKRFPYPVAGIARANYSHTPSQDPAMFFITAGDSVARGDRTWSHLERILDVTCTVDPNLRRIHPRRSLAGVARAGDIVGGSEQLGY